MPPRELPKIRLLELRPSEFSEYIDMGLSGLLEPRGKLKELVLRSKKVRGRVAQFSLAIMRKVYEGGGRYYKVLNEDPSIPGVEKGAEVGLCGLAVTGEQGVLFEQIIKPEFRRKGFGKATRVEREKIARSRGAKTLYLDVGVSDSGQKRRVIREGYKPHRYRLNLWGLGGVSRSYRKRLK